MKRLTLIVAITALASVAAGCGGSDNDKASGGEFNSADVSFAQGMTGHHEQAIDMAKLAPSRAKSAAVKDLAQRIEAAQDPEITQMKAWLKDWDKPVSADGDNGDHGGMDDGAGMMTEAEMADLTKAQGAEFDKMFLEMMTRHHEGAVDTAETELADGKSAEAKKLAQAIIDAQTEEISEMRSLLSQV